MNRPKVCMVSSSGGHYTQLMILTKELNDVCEVIVVTEKTEILKDTKHVKYFLDQFNRRKVFSSFVLLKNLFNSLKIITKEKPKYIISTGAGATVPLSIIGKLYGAKLIFIESFAKRKSPTITGKILYRFADRFYVQWPEMIETFPKAEYKGAIY